MFSGLFFCFKVAVSGAREVDMGVAPIPPDASIQVDAIRYLNFVNSLVYQ